MVGKIRIHFSLGIFGLAPIGFVVLLGEEIGWRGYAQPKLLERYNPFAASLLVGLGWGVWHWIYLWENSSLLGMVYFALETMTISLAYSWLFDRTGGSLVVVTLLHTFYDTIGHSVLTAAPFPIDTLVVLAVHILAGTIAVGLGGVGWFLGKGGDKNILDKMGGEVPEDSRINPQEEIKQ